MNKKQHLIGLVLLIAGLAVMVGCNLQPPTSTGGLSILLDPGALAKSIVPGRSMIVTNYRIEVTGGPTFVDPIETPGPTYTVGNLLAGTYQIRVVGKNAAGNALGEGTASALCVIGAQTPVPVTVYEYMDGTGTFDGRVTWEPAVVVDADVTGSIIPQSGPAIPVVFTGIDSLLCIADIQPMALAPGWYAFKEQLFDTSGVGNVLVSGSVSALRIARDATSTAAIHHYVSAASGDLIVDVTLDLLDPLILTFSHATAPDRIVKNLTDPAFDLVVTGGAPIGSIVSWYKNGVLVKAGTIGTPGDNLVTVDPAALGETSHCYSVTVFTTDGRHGGSGIFNVSVSDPTQRIVQGDVVNNVGVTSPSKIVVELRSGDGATRIDMQTFDPPAAGASIHFNFTNVPTRYYLFAFADMNANAIMDAAEQENFDAWCYWNTGYKASLFRTYPIDIVTFPPNVNVPVGGSVFNFPSLNGDGWLPVAP